jgi:hypothetical protein
LWQRKMGEEDINWAEEKVNIKEIALPPSSY